MTTSKRKLLNLGTGILDGLDEINSTSKNEFTVTAENNVIILENNEFDYNTVDNDTADYLKSKEKEIFDVVQGTYTKTGQILKEAQDRLSVKGHGVFLKWSESIGFKKDTTQRLITRYEFIMKQSEIARQRLEVLPVSMVYEVAKLDKNDKLPEEEKVKINEIKQQVLDGKIHSRKELLSLLEKKEEPEKIAVKGFERNAPITQEILSNMISNEYPDYNKNEIDEITKFLFSKFKLNYKK